MHSNTFPLSQKRGLFYMQSCDTMAKLHVLFTLNNRVLSFIKMPKKCLLSLVFNMQFFKLSHRFCFTTTPLFWQIGVSNLTCYATNWHFVSKACRQTVLLNDSSLSPSWHFGICFHLCIKGFLKIKVNSVSLMKIATINHKLMHCIHLALIPTWFF